jgi:hypothetical protein
MVFEHPAFPGREIVLHPEYIGYDTVMKIEVRKPGEFSGSQVTMPRDALPRLPDISKPEGMKEMDALLLKYEKELKQDLPGMPKNVFDGIAKQLGEEWKMKLHYDSGAQRHYLSLHSEKHLPSGKEMLVHGHFDGTHFVTSELEMRDIGSTLPGVKTDTKWRESGYSDRTICLSENYCGDALLKRFEEDKKWLLDGGLQLREVITAYDNKRSYVYVPSKAYGLPEGMEVIVHTKPNSAVKDGIVNLREEADYVEYRKDGKSTYLTNPGDELAFNNGHTRYAFNPGDPQNIMSRYALAGRIYADSNDAFRYRLDRATKDNTPSRWQVVFKDGKIPGVAENFPGHEIVFHVHYDEKTQTCYADKMECRKCPGDKAGVYVPLDEVPLEKRTFKLHDVKDLRKVRELIEEKKDELKKVLPAKEASTTVGFHEILPPDLLARFPVAMVADNSAPQVQPPAAPVNGGGNAPRLA